MGSWRRGSTPTNIFNVNVDLRGARIYITYSQSGKNLVEKTGEDIEVTDRQLTTVLTQEETLRFKPGPARIQIRYVRENGQADASNVIETCAEEILKDGEIEYV